MNMNAKWLLPNLSLESGVFSLDIISGGTVQDDVFQVFGTGAVAMTGDLTVGGGDATIKAANNVNATLKLKADNSDDAGDDWEFKVDQSNQKLIIGNDIASASTYVSHLEITPHATITSSTVTVAGTLAANAVTDDGNDPTADAQLANKQYVDAQQTVKIAEVTLDESDMNDLHNTAITIVAAQGSNKVIIPTSGMLFIDRDSSTTQSASGANLYVSYHGTSALATTVYYIRRFMWNENGDRMWHLQHYQGEVGDGTDYADNKALTVKLDSAITSGSIDSMKVVVSYFVYDNS